MTMTYARLFLLHFLMIFLIACGGEPKTTAQKVEGFFDAELPVGSSSQAIEDFFKRHKIGFSWDRFSHSYAAIIRDVEPGHAITIDVITDKQGRFLRARVADSYTGL